MMTLANIDEARARVRESGGAELLERLDHLDRVRVEGAAANDSTSRDAPPPVPVDADGVDVDVVLAGGGLWSLLAPVLAARGHSVLVIDRARAASAHREWNASGPELRALVRAGIADDATLDRLTIARYKRGTCRFAGGGDYPVDGVLDHAIDAGPLLAHGRHLAERRGVKFLDGHTVHAHASSRRAVRLRVGSTAKDRSSATTAITARVMVDARGAASPYATADLVCPTVGGVLEGLTVGSAPDEIDPSVGEILATVDDIDPRDRRQHIWEAFPGHPGQTTVYLFYYARTGEPVSLTSLYARFFETRAGYKRGDNARLVRPTFGFIPGWSRLSPAPRPPDPRVLLVGDAAARHSPLTYCGFGSMLRSLERAADAVTMAIAESRANIEVRDLDFDSGDRDVVVDDAPVHALTGALAHMMASRALRGSELNQLLDAAFATLHEMGNAHYAELLRDEMRPADFVTFLRRTAARHPRVWGDVVRGLGPRIAGVWGLGVLRSLWAAA